MGWNKKCKKLRRYLFKGQSDDSMVRVYRSQITIKTDAFGYKYKKITLFSDGLHRTYRLMKHAMRPYDRITW